MEKQKHQLVFVTHNANITVHGDAELIHVMDLEVVAAGDASSTSPLSVELCTLRDSGTIDQTVVRDHIERILEGGRDAFFKRAQKDAHEAI